MEREQWNIDRPRGGGECVTRWSRDVARDMDVGYKASTRGVMAKCVFYMIGGWYVEASTRGVTRMRLGAFKRTYGIRVCETL